VSTSGILKILKNISAWNEDVKSVYKNTINSVLETTEKYESISVSFPAFGTGILKYPRGKVMHRQ
jgi:hypothetical protein